MPISFEADDVKSGTNISWPVMAITGVNGLKKTAVLEKGSLIQFLHINYCVQRSGERILISW